MSAFDSCIIWRDILNPNWQQYALGNRQQLKAGLVVKSFKKTKNNQTVEETITKLHNAIHYNVHTAQFKYEWIA